MKIEFELVGEPVAQSKTKFSRGRCYEPANCTKYKEKIRQAARIAMDGKELITAPLFCVIKFYRKFKRTSRRFGDYDNLYKAVTDAMNKIVYEDDSQIVRCIVEKLTDKVSKIEVKITDEINLYLTLSSFHR